MSYNIYHGQLKYIGIVFNYSISKNKKIIQFKLILVNTYT